MEEGALQNGVAKDGTHCPAGVPNGMKEEGVRSAEEAAAGTKPTPLRGLLRGLHL